MRQIDVVKWAAVAKAHACSRIAGVKIISVALLGCAPVFAEAKCAAFLIVQAHTGRHEICETVKLTPN